MSRSLPYDTPLALHTWNCQWCSWTSEPTTYALSAKAAADHQREAHPERVLADEAYAAAIHRGQSSLLAKQAYDRSLAKSAEAADAARRARGER